MPKCIPLVHLQRAIYLKNMLYTYKKYSVLRYFLIAYCLLRYKWKKILHLKCDGKTIFP